MRTTGLRHAPLPSSPNQNRISNEFHKSLMIKDLNPSSSDCTDNDYNKEHPNITLHIISQSITHKEALARDFSDTSETKFVVPVSPPPPKPPRTFSHQSTPIKELDENQEEKSKSESDQPISHPGPPITPSALYKLKRLDRRRSYTEESTISDNSLISLTTSEQRCLSLTRSQSSRSSISPSNTPTGSPIKTSPVTSLIGESKMAWRNFRRRILAEDVPPPPATPPPSIPLTTSNIDHCHPHLPVNSDPVTDAGSRGIATSTATRLRRPPSSTPSAGGEDGRSDQPNRPNSTVAPTVSARPRIRPASGNRDQSVVRHNRRVVSLHVPPNSKHMFDQGPITNASEFEDICKQVFHLQRNAISLMDLNQYNKAMVKYQMVLGLIDKVLKTKVLDISPDEHTTQKFFQMQEAVFSLRKECLNGFSDAQAAVSLPQELSTTSPPPGAPPSYQDVLREDRRRTTRGPPPPVPVRPLGNREQQSNVQNFPILTQPQARSESQREYQPRLGNPLRQLVQVPSRHQVQPQPSPQTAEQAQSRLNSASTSQSNSNIQIPIPTRPPKPPSQTKPKSDVAQGDAHQQDNKIKQQRDTPGKQSPQQLNQLKSKSDNSQNQFSQQGNQSSIQPEVFNVGNGRQQICDDSKTESPKRPQPLPRTRIKSQDKQSINSPSTSEEEALNKNQSSHVKSTIGQQNIQGLQVQTQIYDQPKQKAYLKNHCQPIGDLLKQDSIKSNQVFDRHKQSITLSDINDKQVEASHNVHGQNCISDSLEMKPGASARITLPRHKKKNLQLPAESTDILYDIPKRHNEFPQALNCNENSEIKSNRATNLDEMLLVLNHPKAQDEKPSPHKEPPKPARRKVLAQQKSKNTSKETYGYAIINKPAASSKSNSTKTVSILETYDSATGVSNSIPRPNTEKSVVQSTIIDCFKKIDPFPLVSSNSAQNEISFSDEDSSIIINDNLNNKDNPNVTQQLTKNLPTPIKPVPLSNPPQKNNESITSDSGIENIYENNLQSEETSRNLGDSLLDALDFACTTKSPEVSNVTKYSRCHSEHTLLDYSISTLGRFLESKENLVDNAINDQAIGQNLIVGEFDPLISITPTPGDSQEEKTDINPPLIKETESSSSNLSDNEEGNDSYYAVPRKLKSKTLEKVEKSNVQIREEEKGKKEETVDILYENTKSKDCDLTFDKDDYPASPYHIYAEVGSQPSVPRPRGSVTSWPSDYSKDLSSPTPSTPSTVGAGCRYWGPHLEESSDEYSEDIGRSAFYRAISSDQTSNDEEKINPLSMHPSHHSSEDNVSSSSTTSSRELLRIREGVKIFFIHEDGVVTSPWNRPFLSVTKDSSKYSQAKSLLLRVGKSLYSCELISKATMVYKTDGSTYVFKETNNRPDCIAVAIRIPNAVRKVQHVSMLRIMQEHARLEEERPSGITKSVSKGAASAATKVGKMVENQETEPTQAFVRRNSIRALRGVTKGLKSLAEKTGATIPELPEEYTNLHEAANTLKFSRTAKTVQYI